MSTPKKRSLWIVIAVSAALLSLLSGCNSSSQATSAPAGSPTTPTGTNSTTSSTSTSTTTTTTTSFTPSLTFSYTITGSTKITTPAISTDNIFQVQVSAEAATTSLGSNFIANYNCISYQITVAGDTQTTEELQIPSATSTQNYDCPNAPTSQVLDFSSVMQAGHGKESIEISNVETDTRFMDCVGNQWIPSYGMYGCAYYYPLAPIYDARSFGTNAAWRAQVTLGVAIN